MEPMELPDDFVEFLRLLNDHDVEYLLVGGLAVAIHGYPRATKDMDVWVAISPDNANRLLTSSNGWKPLDSRRARCALGWLTLRRAAVAVSLHVL